MTAGTLERVEAIFREVLELPPGVDPRATGARRTPTWDSLNHVMLVAALESEFGVTIDLEESLRMTTFPAALEILARAGIAVDAAEPGP